MSDIFGKSFPPVIVACSTCNRYHRDNNKAFSCDAFERIPKEILDGDNMHTEPLAGQRNQITYEKE